MNISKVWIFIGERARFPSAVFTDKFSADNWININKLTGILTGYPLDISIYEWAIKNNLFEPKNSLQESPEFIQGFTSANLEHYHYENGSLD